MTKLVMQQQRLVIEHSSALNTRLALVQKYLPNNQVAVVETGAVRTVAIPKTVEEYLAEGRNKLSTFARQKLRSVPKLLISATLYVFLLASMLLHGRRMVTILRDCIPLSDDVAIQFLGRIGAVVRGVFWGGIAIAALQAMATVVLFAVAGFPYLGVILVASFLLYFLLIGTAILYIPMAGYLALQGKIWLALAFVVLNFLVANLDNLLRSRFLNKAVQMNTTILFLGVVSGMSLFGVLGVFYGPVLVLVGLRSYELLRARRN